MNLKAIKLFVKHMILKNKFLYEIYFFLTGKKINRYKIDRKIYQFQKFHVKKKCIDGLIVSLTTYGERLKDIRYTLYSILDQNILPEKVVLWISHDDYEKNLAYIKYLERIFNTPYLDIRKTENIFSYKKLIPALENFPDCYILTADDDIYYRKNWLKKIWDEHKKNPENIICHVAHKILLKGKEVLPYIQWKKNVRDIKPSFFLFGCGGGGVLYHRLYLHKDVVKEDIFLKLAPTADDIWFYFMVVMNNRKYQVVKRPYNRLKYTDIYKEYGLNNKQTLESQNVDNGRNDVQFASLVKYYNFDFSKFQ
jgi:hypothetical protein